MTVKGHHPIAEIVARKLSGIETMPPEVTRTMVNNAARAATEYAEKLEAERARLREALAVYADKKNWKRDEYGHLCVFITDTNALYPALDALKGRVGDD